MFRVSRRTLVWSDQSPVRAKIIWEIIDLFLYFLEVKICGYEIRHKPLDFCKEVFYRPYVVPI